MNVSPPLRSRTAEIFEFSRRPATRYVVPLREGGSLPAVVDADDGTSWVVKFRGSGQGAKALLAELIVGALARRLGLPVPELTLIELDESFGRLEPDPEIQDILRGSRGLNVGLGYLEGAYNFDAAADLGKVSVLQASRTVCLDALCWNIDRTARNPNLMVHGGEIWLIDHGAALYVHHDWDSADAAKARRPFGQLADHVLLPRAAGVREAVEEAMQILGRRVFAEILAAVPESLLLDAPPAVRSDFSSADAARTAYVDLLTTRLEALPGVLSLAEWSN